MKFLMRSWSKSRMPPSEAASPWRRPSDRHHYRGHPARSACHLVVCLCAGIGKSTLLGLIAGTLEPTQGTITRNPKVREQCHHSGGL
jgi:hypothetical protein